MVGSDTYSILWICGFVNPISLNLLPLRLISLKWIAREERARCLALFACKTFINFPATESLDSKEFLQGYIPPLIMRLFTRYPTPLDGWRTCRDIAAPYGQERARLRFHRVGSLVKVFAANLVRSGPILPLESATVCAVSLPVGWRVRTERIALPYVHQTRPGVAYMPFFAACVVQREKSTAKD